MSSILIFVSHHHNIVGVCLMFRIIITCLMVEAHAMMLLVIPMSVTSPRFPGFAQSKHTVICSNLVVTSSSPGLGGDDFFFLFSTEYQVVCSVV